MRIAVYERSLEYDRNALIVNLVTMSAVQFLYTFVCLTGKETYG